MLSGVWLEPLVADGSRGACAHVVVANTGNFPTAFELDLTGLPSSLIVNGSLEVLRVFDGTCVLQAGAGNEACSAASPTAAYSLQAMINSRGGSGPVNATLHDFIDNQATNVYRIGCTLRSPDPDLMVADGGFEEIHLAQPTLPFDSTGGGGAHFLHHLILKFPWLLSLIRYVLWIGGSHGGWNGGVQFGNFTDDRVRLEVSNAAPHSGRYAGRLQLPTDAAVTVIVPLTKAAATSTRLRSAHESRPAFSPNQAQFLLIVVGWR